MAENHKIPPKISTDVHPMNGDTQIIVSGREYKVKGPTVTYKEIVEIWNKLHESEGIHIVGTPASTTKTISRAKTVSSCRGRPSTSRTGPASQWTPNTSRNGPPPRVR